MAKTPKLRKMLNDVNSDYIQSFMRLIETQSKETIAKWCVCYALIHVLPLWSGEFPEDSRPATALVAASDFLNGSIKLADAKKQILECRTAAREAEGSHIAQGAARTIDAAASTIHNSAGSISIAFYGALTIAYSKKGLDATWEVLEQAAIEECLKMKESFAGIMVADEPNPAKINWGC